MERAPTEPPPLPEPPSRGDQKTAEASIVLAEELGAPRVDRDHTEIVVPLTLESHVHTAPVRRPRRRRFIYAGAALALFGAAALAVTFATSSELPAPVVTRRAPVVVPEPVVVPAPVAVAPKADVVAAAVAPAAPVAPVAVAPVAVAPVVTKAPVAPDPAPAAVAPKPRKAIAHPVKKVAKPKYDPDALFFKGN